MSRAPFELFAVALDQSVDRVTEELRRGVLVFVPGRVLARVVQAIVGTQVHDLDAAFEQRGDKRLTLSVGQAQEHHVEFCLKNGRGRLHREVGIRTGQ